MIKFVDHTNLHIVEEIKKKHLEWVDEKGLCGKCLDHYKRTKQARV